MKNLIVIFSLLVFSSVAFASERVEKVGVVGIAGNAPFTKVTFIDANSSQTYELVGFWRSELVRLGGVKVKIIALLHNSTKNEANQNSAIIMPKLDVVEYEIVDVGGGVKPFVGFLHKDGSKLMLHVKDIAEPIKVMARGKVKKKLESLVGSKVWMTGKLTSPYTLRPMRFAAISKISVPKKDSPQNNKK